MNNCIAIQIESAFSPMITSPPCFHRRGSKPNFVSHSAHSICAFRSTARSLLHGTRKDRLDPVHSARGTQKASRAGEKYREMSQVVKKEKTAGGKERKVRSRAACGSCKSTKQKCDGPNVELERCRRCELYSLECVFPTSSGPLYCIPQKYVQFRWRIERVGDGLFMVLRGK